MTHGANRTGKQEKSGSRRKKNTGKRGQVGLPNIRDIKLGHMQKTCDLLELYRQAIAIGLAKPSEAGRLDFLALAERAKSHGKRAGALFFWLLREKKTLFITQSEEDAAVTRIRALHNPENTRRRNQSQEKNQQQWGREQQRTPKPSAELTKDEQFVVACIRVAKKHRIADPFRMAHSEGWTREQWDKALESYEAKQWMQLQQSHATEETE